MMVRLMMNGIKYLKHLQEWVTMMKILVVEGGYD